MKISSLNRLRKICVDTTLMFFVLFTPSMAQEKPEILTNQTVISLVKAGLDKSVIVTTINNAESKFDVTSVGLINLKKQGVPNEVISVMVEKGVESPKENRQTSPVVANTKRKSALKVEFVNHPYLLNVGSNTTIPLERNVANMATKTKAFGYGGVSSQFEIEGIKGTVRKMSTDSIAFVVNTSGGAPEFVLYKTKIEKGKRVAVSLTAKPIGGAKSGNNTIAFNMFPESNGLFRLVPSQKLEKGEYFFAGKSSGNANSLDVYAFGVD